MALTEEEAEKIKEHLLNQLGNFPQDKQELIKDQVNALTPDQVESFINQNELTHLGNQCIFCSIVSGKTPSVKIAENKDNIAILEINPISKGHSLVLPKEHLKLLPESAQEVAKEVIEKIKKKFNPKDVKTKESQIMDHALLEIVPIYGDEKERHPAKVEDLEKIKEELNKIETKKEEDENKEPQIPKLKSRIP